MFQVLEKMGHMVTILHGHMVVVDHEHVAVPGGDLFVLGIEQIEGAVDDLIGRIDMITII